VSVRVLRVSVTCSNDCISQHSVYATFNWVTRSADKRGLSKHCLLTVLTRLLVSLLLLLAATDAAMVWCSAEELARLVAAAAALKHSPAPGWLERVEAASHAQLGGCHRFSRVGPRRGSREFATDGWQVS
jgi:hypothetical protein